MHNSDSEVYGNIFSCQVSSLQFLFKYRVFLANMPAIIPTSVFIARQHTILLLTRDIDIVILSVRLSVRDTVVLYENGLTYRHSFSTIR